MRSRFTDQGGLFSYIAPDKRVPANHPLRKVRELVRDVLSDLNRSLGKLYASEGRPSIPPEQLLSALLLQVFYGIRSERQLMEQLDYNLLYRWFVGLSPDDPVWDPTTFTKNRERLQNGDVFTKFMTRLLNHPQVKPLLSDEHFSVDGTLIDAWASQKSFRPKDGSGDDDDGHDQRPWLIGLNMRARVGLLPRVVFRCFFAHQVPPFRASKSVKIPKVPLAATTRKVLLHRM